MGSECQPQSKLKLACRAGSAYFAEVTRIHARVWVVQVHKVECVGHLHPELKLRPLSDIEGTQESDIDALRSRSLEGVPARIAKKCAGYGLHKRRRVKPCSPHTTVIYARDSSAGAVRIKHWINAEHHVGAVS